MVGSEAHNSILSFAKKICWPMMLYWLAIHIAAIYGVLWNIATCKLETLLFSLLLYLASGISITGGYHRLWSHRSYKATWGLRIYYMILGSIANAGTIYQWVGQHRAHHKHSETEADPHNVSIDIDTTSKLILLTRVNNNLMVIGNLRSYTSLFFRLKEQVVKANLFKLSQIKTK